MVSEAEKKLEEEKEDGLAIGRRSFIKFMKIWLGDDSTSGFVINGFSYEPDHAAFRARVRVTKSTTYLGEISIVFSYELAKMYDKIKNGD